MYVGVRNGGGVGYSESPHAQTHFITCMRKYNMNCIDRYRDVSPTGDPPAAYVL